MGYKSDRAALLHAQLACRHIDLEIVLFGDGADLCLGLFSDQRAVIQRPGNCGFGNPSQAGDISDGFDRVFWHEMTLSIATGCIVKPAIYFVKR